MEESLKFNSQVCTTKEQSQRLLDLGLKPETADMYYHEGSEDGAGNIEYHRNIRTERDNILFPDYIPAWSLHRLMEILDAPLVEFAFLSYDPYEEIIYNVSECIKNGYINKEYLKQ